MKILCVIDSLCFGGAQRQLIELALAFKERGHVVAFLTYHHIPFFNSLVENENIPVSCIEEPNYLKRLFKMRRVIRNGNYDAVLSFLEAANFIAEFAGIPYRKWRLVVGERSANPEILKSFKLRFYRWFHFFADSVVANSETNMRIVSRVNPFLSRAKCQIIYNTLDFNEFKPLPNFSYRKQNKTSVLVAARIQYEKNLTGLIEALTLLPKEDRERIQIDWYGELKKQPGANIFFAECQALIKKKDLSGILTFHPATLDIKKIIQECDAVGLFSFYEGLPNIICEAMACEKAVLCTNVSDIALFLSHEPNLLCEPTNPCSIKDALSYLIRLNNQQLKAIGEKNRTIALSNFNKEQIVSSYLHLLGDGIENSQDVR
jgi:glycosyltransferase involved in cell wall biosynthesis